MWKDVGPYGSSGHAHCSKLAINLRAYGSMLLVDSGRFQYNGEGLSETLNREYERTTSAHNTLIFDGKQQAASPAVAASPIANSSWRFTAEMDFVRGATSLYDGIAGSVTHQRGTVFTKVSAAKLPPYIVVVDKVTTDRARTVQAAWHAHPNANVTMSLPPGGAAKAAAATIVGVNIATKSMSSAKLHLIPSANAGGFAWSETQLVRGQYGNASAGLPWQGWYSDNYNGNSTAPTLVYNGNVPASGAVFAWLLVPEDASSSGSASASSNGDQADHHAKIGAASMRVVSSDSAGLVKTIVSINGVEEVVVVDLGPPPPPPPPPPPCPAHETRVECLGGSGSACAALSVPCPQEMKLDVVLVSGDDGSCSCAEYCATDWGGAIKAARPHWQGAASAAGNSTHSGPFAACGVAVCACVRGTHFCPKYAHECKEGCNVSGVPSPTDACIPA